MFAIGEATGEVCREKVQLPKSYGLGKKGKKTYGAWLGEQVLYLSDDAAPLRSKVGRSGRIFAAKIDASSRLTVSEKYNGAEVRVSGRISTIKVEFLKKDGS